ncbi:hypothetical protein [Streptomyces spectabilis]|uniref:Uncharacterized protein n=1 Tax=Streptomyces spectabilis TaxID=68270 RepID=A0A7W8APN5_STRST|nr:hypothetical protein [Streptomyces spectabilis]MBB5102258.1 hypothetical protein [Streptomyces spectabilis]MCI3907306.1 hypothetical protein [Streptomyces spectabilis]GGV29760.1 hypothetical protein GCM10010245_48320 [Streptomyces spectabilis]
MVTAWSPRHIVRARAVAESSVAPGPLLRFLALAVLLFAVALTHGASPGTTGAHLATSAVSVQSAAEDLPVTTAEPTALGAAGDGHAEHGPVHSNEQCASGQPTQGPAFAPSCLAASVGQPDTPGHPAAGRSPGTAEYAVTPAVALKTSVVQQV